MKMFPEPESQFKRPKLVDAVLKTSSEINVQTLKQYVIQKLKSEYQIEMNDVELLVDNGSAKMHILKNNKERICDLMRDQILSEEKLINRYPYYYGYWIRGSSFQREVIYVRIRNFG